jgi:hypothetical protein
LVLKGGLLGLLVSGCRILCTSFAKGCGFRLPFNPALFLLV